VLPTLRLWGAHGARLAAALAAVACFGAAWLGAPATVGAAAASTGASDSPVQVSSPNTRPLGFNLTAGEAERIAAGIPLVGAELKRHPDAQPTEYTRGGGRWQVSWFGPGGKELIQVVINDVTGAPLEAWTGFQVAWPMARGAPGAFGHKLNHPWVWIPLCLAFFVPFAPLRRGRRSSWLHLDLLMLLGFSVSLAFFNEADLGLSVPLAYPFLLYLLGRMLLLGFGRGRPRAPVRLLVPIGWLAVALVALAGFRVWMNVDDSGVIDVGYAGVIGADRLVHGQPLYGHWPSDNATGDTYGPVNYYAYVPFRAAFDWSGRWDDLPAGHAAAIFFDLLTMVGLFLLGRRVRGPTLGVVLAYAWAAYPFTLYALQSNSNDSLVAALLVWALLGVGRPVASGVGAALATMAKLVPIVLAPLLARGLDARWRVRRVATFGLAFGVTIAVVMLPVVLNASLHLFWNDTVARQVDRSSPFSIWGLWGGLGLEQHLAQAGAVALAVLVAFVPRRRGILDVAALGAAVLIAVQLGLTHWFYLYIPWFFPFVAVAVFGVAMARADDAEPGGHTDAPATADPDHGMLTPRSHLVHREMTRA
jgi:Glycosyltransferase family 87